MTPRTLRIDNGRGTLIVGEHPDSCYICVMAGDAGTSMFLTPDKCEEVGLMLWRLGRKMKRKRPARISL